MKYLLSLLLLTASWATPAAIHEVRSLSPIKESINQKLRAYDASEILVVLDIDNTLLTSTHDIASYGWSRWQRSLIKAGHPDAITDDMSKYFQIEAVLYTLGRMRTAESQTADFIEQLQSQNIPVIALTSRGPRMRNSTERELRRNRIHLELSDFHGGFAGDYTADLGAGRLVSFQKGVYMTSGQNKGLMLKDLLRKVNKDYSVIYFVDDSRKHVEHMQEAYSQLGENIQNFRYGRMDAKVDRFLNSDKTQVIADWLKFNSIWQKLFR